MTIMDQGCYFTMVNREKENELISKTVFLKTDFEATVSLVVDISSFKIKEAKWEINRAKDNNLLKEGAFPELIGTNAYFDGGKSIRKISGTGDDETIRELFLDCIRGFIQGETYIFEERGYESKAAYYDSWKSEQINTCRYFSHLDREVCTWFEYIGDYKRKSNLFNRSKGYSIEKKENGMIYAKGNLIDSYHEMNVEFSFSEETKVIKSCSITMPRVPGPVCAELSESAKCLVGMQLDCVNKKAVIKALGGSEGCFHLVNIVLNIVVAAQKNLN